MNNYQLREGKDSTTNSKDSVEILLWMNGKPKEQSFKYLILNKSTITENQFNNKQINNSTQ